MSNEMMGRIVELKRSMLPGNETLRTPICIITYRRTSAPINFLRTPFSKICPTNMTTVAFSRAWAAAYADPLRFAADSSLIIYFPILD